MLSIATTYSPFASTRPATTHPTGPATAFSRPAGTQAASGGGNHDSRISASARQLSEATARADARAGMAHQQLGQKAAALLQQISGEGYGANRQLHDSEVPGTDDPVLLARARQATDFLHGKAANPFKGLSREQLALIAYDEGGSFTVNERRAACQEAGSQEYAWRQKAVRQAMDEYNSTGKMTGFFSEALAHYASLPDVERAQYPEDYASRLQGWIDLDFNDKTHSPQGQDAAGLAGRLFGLLSGRAGLADAPESLAKAGG